MYLTVALTAVCQPLCYIEFTDEQKEMQQVARKFTQDEIIPKAAYHDQTGEVTKHHTVCLVYHLYTTCHLSTQIFFAWPLYFGVVASSFVFSSPVLSGRRLDVYHTSTHEVASVHI